MFLGICKANISCIRRYIDLEGILVLIVSPDNCLDVAALEDLVAALTSRIRVNESFVAPIKGNP